MVASRLWSEEEALAASPGVPWGAVFFVTGWRAVHAVEEAACWAVSVAQGAAVRGGWLPSSGIPLNLVQN